MLRGIALSVRAHRAVGSTAQFRIVGGLGGWGETAHSQLRTTPTCPNPVATIQGCRWWSPVRNKTKATPHDIGGVLDVFGPVATESTADLQEWEVSCHALLAILAIKGHIVTDELRRAIEALTAEQYTEFSYYEKWSAAMATLLVERGVLERGEIEKRLFGESKQIDPNTPARFAAGDAVRVKRSAGPPIGWRRPHLRTPGYVYGVTGIVERVSGRFRDPTALAFGFAEPIEQLYRVQFRQGDLWPEQLGDSYSPEDVVEVEIFENWLEPPTSEPVSTPPTELFDHSSHHNHDYGHGHHGHHHHEHDHTDTEHVHEPRPFVEIKAVEREGLPRPGDDVHRALRALLIEKGVVNADELRAFAEHLESAGTRLDGATLVARAWVDEDFRTRLIADPPSTAAELGIKTSNPNAPTILTVVPNTPTTHNLVVCTLCSCYPSSLLGLSPAWYKSREYRARAVREPRAVLAEFGLTDTDLEDKRIRVHDSTADHRYIVLPERPDGTDGWSEEALKDIITRDSMIGVTVPCAPQ